MSAIGALLGMILLAFQMLLVARLVGLLPSRWYDGESG